MYVYVCVALLYCYIILLLLLQKVNVLLYIILLFWEFFTPVLADSFSLESEWQQVS